MSGEGIALSRTPIFGGPTVCYLTTFQTKAHEDPLRRTAFNINPVLFGID